MSTRQINIRKEYNALETMNGEIYFTEATISEIQPLLENKFILLSWVLIATHQIIKIRPANGKEYYEKFIYPSLSTQMNNRVQNLFRKCENEKVIPSLDTIETCVRDMIEEDQKLLTN